MKMMIAIIRDNDNDPVSQALVAAGFRVTRIASTGGFLRRGSSTLIIGVENEQVEQAIQILRESTTTAEDANTRRVTLFVINVEHFTQI